MVLNKVENIVIFYVVWWSLLEATSKNSIFKNLTKSTPLARQMQAHKRSCAFLASLS